MKTFFKWLFILFFTGTLLAVGGIVGLYYYVKPNLPSVETLRDVQLQTPMQVYTRDGFLISQFGEQRRIPVTYEQIPEQLLQAVIATEDSRFYHHFGIDPIGVLRAFSVLVTTGSMREGASTITMQVARNFFLTRDRIWTRKIHEAFIALHIENLLSKEEIITLYMNKPGLGHRAFGVAAAAEVYYGRTLDELTLGELATIAGLFQAPSALNPISNPEASVRRRNIVLRRMLEVGYINQEEYQNASSEPVTASYHTADIEVSAPYMAEMVRREMIDRYGEELAYNSGMQVYTTIYAKQQQAAESALRLNLHAYDERHGYRGAVAKLWGYTTSQLQQLRVGGPIDETTYETIKRYQGQAWNKADTLRHLARQPRYGQLVPAVVLDVLEHQVLVLLRSGAEYLLPWESIHWARPFLDHDRQGPAPTQATQIFTAGDQIWLRPDQEQQWRLAQLPGPGSAFVALDPSDGAIQAIVGGYSFNESQYNRATQAKRQIGSTIKPFLYAAALEHDFTLATIVNDAPITQWDASSYSTWRPRNSPDVYNGPIRLREALARSKNVVSVRLLRAIGVHNVADSLLRFGFANDEIVRTEALALGTPSFTPLEMARAFATFTNEGFLIEPYFIDYIEDRKGKMIYQARPVIACDPCTVPEEELHEGAPQSSSHQELDTLQKNIQQAPRVLSEHIAFLVRDATRSVIWGGGSWAHQTGWNGTAWRAQALKNRNISGKTGTTNNMKDAWFAGFMEGTVGIMWVGFDNLDYSLGRVTLNSNLTREEQPIVGAEAGATTSLPGWILYMQDVLPMTKANAAKVPNGIISIRIDEKTGLLSRRADYTSTFEYFIQGTAPDQYVNDDDQAPLIFEDEDSDLFN